MQCSIFSLSCACAFIMLYSGCSDGCWCDNQCALHGDCCDDKASYCALN